MSKRNLTIVVLLLFSSSTVWAQRDYRKGYIITNQQDTVYGWIDYRGDIRNAKICSFKQTENGQATDYTPSDIAAYRFNDSKFYISKNIGNPDAPKQIFLEYLVNGLAKLYYYRDDNTNDHYYIENEGKFMELKIDEKEVEIDGKTQIKTMKTYVGILKATLNVWDMRNEIDNARLEHSSLINIAKNYHQYACTDGSECIIYEKKKPLMALRIAPVVGVDLSILKMQEFDSDRIRYNLPKTYKPDPSTNFTVGVNLNFSMPRINEKIFLQMQTMYTKYYFFDTYESQQKGIDIHITSNVLQMRLSIKYEYPKGKWRPTMAAGVAAIWLPDGSIEEITDTYFIAGTHSSTEINDFPTKFMPGFEVTPGIHYYLTPKQIIFLQAQFLQSYKRGVISFPANQIRSFGLSAGIFF